MELTYTSESFRNAQMTDLLSDLGITEFSASYFIPRSLFRFHEYSLQSNAMHPVCAIFHERKPIIYKHCQHNTDAFQIDANRSTVFVIPFHLPGNVFCGVAVSPQHAEILSKSENYLRLFNLLSAGLKQIRQLEQDFKLSEREKQCICWLAEGKTTWEIATILNISERTANFHVNNILQKTQSNNRNQALTRYLLAAF